MPFDSYVFVLIFLPLLVFVWRAVAVVHRESLGLVLLCASVVFCLWASPAALLLLGLLIPVNYGMGLALAAPGEREGSLRRRSLLTLALLINFSPLILIRYLPEVAALVPALHSLSSVTAAPELPFLAFLRHGMTAGTEQQGFVLGTAAYAGMSFWTLVQAAWLTSIYRRHIEPEGILRHGLFSLAFPWLLAGPVVRYEQMGRQLDALDAPALSTLTAGLGIFLTGLAKKVLLANWLGSHADTIFAAAAAADALTSMEALLGILAFSFQIYFDFSGYSDMAIGAGLMLGLHIPANFAAPYRATGFIDFWRRWHITLSSFMRDFVYQPLAGAAPSFPRALLAVAAGMVLTALWHGATATFLIWILIHAVFLALNAILRSLKSPGLDALLSGMVMRPICILLTFALVSLAWIFFRADSLPHALALCSALVNVTAPHAFSCFDNGHFAGVLSLLPLFIAAFCVFALPTSREIFLGCRDGSRPWLSFAPSLPWALILAAAAFACLSVMDLTRPFIF